MKPLTHNDAEAELSYAYIHAVAAACQVSCEVKNRHGDNAGVDADLTSWGPFDDKGDSYLDEVLVRVQLKATVKKPADDGIHLSYFLADKGERYDDLRKVTLVNARILVVLFLPKEKEQWLDASDDALRLSHCAYWTSLRGAPAAPEKNKSGLTVKLPKAQPFHPENLRALMNQLARREYPMYEEPK